MKRKLVVCAVVLTTFSVGAKAQSTTSSTSSTSGAIIKAGVNFANISVNDDGDVDDNKTLTSFHVGITGDFDILPFLAIQPGIFFTGKGSKTQSGSTNDANYYKATTNPKYIEVPVNLVFKTPPGPARFFIGAGPYIAMGVGGKNKVEGKLLGSSFSSEENIDWSNDDPTTGDEEDAGYGRLRRFDYGLNGLIGVEASNFVVSAGYGLGLAKIQSGTDSDDDNKNKHRVFSVSLGFKF